MAEAAVLRSTPTRGRPTPAPSSRTRPVAALGYDAVGEHRSNPPSGGAALAEMSPPDEFPPDDVSQRRGLRRAGLARDVPVPLDVRAPPAAVLRVAHVGYLPGEDRRVSKLPGSSATLRLAAGAGAAHPAVADWLAGAAGRPGSAW